MLSAIQDEIYTSQILMSWFEQLNDKVSHDTLRYPLQERSLEGARDRELSRRYSNAFMIGGLGQMLKAWTEEGFAASVEEIAGSVQFLVPSVPAE